MGVLAMGVLAMGVLFAVPAAWAHGDHGAAPPGAASIAPRTDARIGTMEIVAVFSHQALAVFVSRFADGAPVSGAKVSVSSDLQSADLEQTDQGLYVTRDILLAPGHNDLTVSLTVDGVTKTQDIGLSTPGEHAAAKPAGGKAAMAGSWLALPSAALTLVALPLAALTGNVALSGSVAAVLLLGSGTMLLWRRRVRALNNSGELGLRWQDPA